MDGQVGEMDTWIDEQTEGFVVGGWIDGGMGRLVDGWVNRCVGSWVDGWMSRLVGGWVNGWVGSWVDG